MSIFDKINKKRTGDDPQQYSDQQYDDLLYDDDLQEYDDLEFDDLEFEEFLQSELEDNYFPDEFELNGARDDTGFDDYYYENEEYNEEYQEGEDVWYEPASVSQKPVLQLPFRSPDNMMIVICLILFVILLFFCGFLGVKTHALSESNTRLEQRVQKDTKLRKSESEYEAETEDLESETDRLINSYGAGNTPEKTIMFLSNLSSTSGLSVTSIEFGKSENVTVDENGKRLKGAAEAPDPTKSSASSDSDKKKNKDKDDKSSKKGEKSNQYYLYKYQVTFSYTGSYAQMKRAIEFIEDYGERTTVNDITSTYDETTNNLTGSMTLNMYTLSGTAQEYKAPSVSGSLGNADIFG